MKLSAGFEGYVESGKRTLKQLKDFRKIARKVKRMAEGVWEGCKVYVFGSVLDGRYTASSDIDILLVVDGIGREEAVRVKAMILRAIDAPIELHIVSREEFERWYRRFIDKLEEIR